MTSGGDNRVTVVTLADERYALALAVLGRSLCDTTEATRPLTLVVVDGGLTEDTKRHLLDSWDLDRLNVRFVAPQFGSERVLPVWGRLPALTYVRIFLPLLVPDDCQKAVFLDSDVMVRHDIADLWGLDLGGHHLLAVQDPAVPFVSSRDGLRRFAALGIPQHHPYFNAGVMVVDVARWRESHVSERVMDFIHRHANELNYCDQDGLNAVLWQDWNGIDCRWQVQPRFMTRRLPLPHLDDDERRRAAEDPWIVHFSGRLKPWIYSGSTSLDRLFHDYLGKTWWSGWRPPSSMKAWAYRRYDSAMRGWCYPIEQRGHALLRRWSRHSEVIPQT
jgi:lipopolysaccharide biosynthesis glycosyltransferase